MSYVNFRSLWKTETKWQKADDFAVDVYETTKSFPRHQLYSLIAQMQMEAVSVAAK
jgi:four helix bundle protein